MANEFLGYPYVDVSITEETNDFQTTSQNLKTQTVSNGAQRWILDITFTGDMWSKLNAEINAHYVGNKTAPFDVTFPQHWLIKPTNSNNILSDANYNAGTASIGLYSSTGFTLPIGYYFKFANHNKVYLITAAINSTAGGSTTLQFYPQLTTNVPYNTQIIVDDVMIKVNHDFRNSSTTYRRGVIQSWRAKFLEHL